MRDYNDYFSSFCQLLKKIATQQHVFINTGIYELDQINVATEGMQKELVATMEDKWKKEQDSKAQMAQIAHDLKTPLTVIRGNADLFMEKDCDEESRESLEAIVRNSEKIAMSVHDILEK